MSVPFQRISVATVDNLQFYDPNAYARITTEGIDFDQYLNVGSQEILYNLEFGWWPKYVENTWGAWYFKTDSEGRVLSAFDPTKLILDDQNLIQLDIYKALEYFYYSKVNDAANINKVDKENLETVMKRFDDAWKRATQLSNFYDLFGDADPTTSKLEENYQADVNAFTGDQRYF